jgi:hypothetical protein
MQVEVAHSQKHTVYTLQYATIELPPVTKWYSQVEERKLHSGKKGQ